jgi:hypothetical protein
MKTPEYFITNKKVYAGHYDVTVTDTMNNIEVTYTEKDMDLIDIINDEANYDSDEAWTATQKIIANSGIEN